MATVNESAWNTQDELSNNRNYSADTVSGPSDNTVDPDEDDLDEDDDLIDDEDDLDYDEDDLDDDTLDDDDDTDEDQDGYDRVGGATAGAGLSSGIASSYDNDDNTPGGDENEIPEQQEADTENQGYEGGEEVQQQNHNDEASYSERNDVTPPTPHEFPDHGTHTETDFASRNLGRTTGRMVGHEPGTESGNV